MRREPRPLCREVALMKDDKQADLSLGAFLQALAFGALYFALLWLGGLTG